MNADILSLDSIQLNEHEPHVNALGIRVVGEIGSAGVIPNAVWHPTGVRVRLLPITLDRLI